MSSIVSSITASMEGDGADFRSRFREARQKRAKDRGGSTLQEKVKRLKAEKADKHETASITSDSNKRLSREEEDSIRMPPPAPITKAYKSNPSATSIAAKSPSTEPMVHETVASVHQVFTAVQTAENAAATSLPEDFFELKNKQIETELEKERRMQQTSSEYQRFHQEIAGSLDEIAESETLEAEEDEIRQEERDEYEQQLRMSHIQELKTQRKNRPIVASTTTTQPRSSSSSDDTEDDDDEDITNQWRTKKL